MASASQSEKRVGCLGISASKPSIKSARHHYSLTVLLLLTSLLAHAATFSVNERQDLPDANPGDGQALTATGKTSFRAAVEEANALPGLDTINITAAVAYRSVALVRIEAPLFITDDLEIDSGYVLTVSIQGDTPYRAVEVSEGVYLGLRRVTFSPPGRVESVAIADRGAVMMARPGARVYWNGGGVQGGRATERGGGIYLDHASLIFGAVISGQSDGDGGGIYNDHGTILSGGVSVGGEALGRGGAIFNDGGIMIYDSNLTSYLHGTAAAGGGLYSKGGFVAFHDIEFESSTAEDGGAIYMADGAEVIFDRCSFHENTASGNGGAVYLASGILRATMCTFGAGTARNGGALFAAGGSARLLNCTVTVNEVEHVGGGAYIDVLSELVLGNTILAGNLGLAAPDVYGRVTSLGHNLIGNAAGGEGLTSDDIGGTAASPVAPMLEHRTGHEGTPEAPRNIYLPLEGSPVIDAGNTSLLFHEDFAGTACFDARLTCCSRVRGMAVDIGAIEVQQGDDSFTCAEGMHSADFDHDRRIALNELIRIIQFYNSPGLHCDTAYLDEYAPGDGAQDCAPHAADYNPQDWRITLNELLRIVQFYNAGGYTECEGSEDGFCPGAG